MPAIGAEGAARSPGVRCSCCAGRSRCRPSCCGRSCGCCRCLSGWSASPSTPCSRCCEPSSCCRRGC